MDSKTFREFGKAAIDFVADYLDTIKECDVLPSVTPGYLLELLDSEMPRKPESWSLIFEDINRYIKPGLTHWQSPNMHAFYPTATSFPSIVGELLSAAFGVVGFNWISSPACTELEMVVMDWLAKFLKLPKHFLHESKGSGGGIIQGSASEAVLMAVLTAREMALRRFKTIQPDVHESDIRGKLVAYSSDQSNSCVEKAGLLAVVPFRLISTAESYNSSLNGKALAKAVVEDISKGLIPTICVATLGTTTTCAFDDVSSLAEVCKKYNIWLHVDAAYAGVVLALEEYSILHKGLNLIDSLNINLHKMMMVNFDCCAMWMKNAKQVADSFNVERIYLKHKYEDQSRIPDFRHWQIPLGRRFRALKVWITMRCTGTEGFKAHLRHHIRLAKHFESLVHTDIRFELICPSSIGLVCFRLKGDNQLTTKLLQLLTEHKKIYLIQATKGGKNFLRFVVAGIQPKQTDIDYAWSQIQTHCNILFQMENHNNSTKIDFQWTKDLHDNKAKIIEKLV